MNEHDVTALLERLVAEEPMSVPPVASVTTKGRRRLVIRRGGQVFVAASVATAFTIGGLALGSVSGRGALTPAATVGVVTGRQVLPGQPPTVAQVLGTWHWVGPRSAGGSAAPLHPSSVTFSHQSAIFYDKPQSTPPLFWAGNAGCKGGWETITGSVLLKPDGSFSAGNEIRQNCHAQGDGHATTLGEVLNRTAWLRLVDGQLRFFSVHGQLVATFSKS